LKLDDVHLNKNFQFFSAIRVPLIGGKEITMITYDDIVVYSKLV